LFGKDSHGVSSFSIKINARQTPGFKIANPSSCDDEQSQTDGHDSNSGVDSEIEKRGNAKKVVMAIESDNEWK